MKGGYSMVCTGVCWNGRDNISDRIQLASLFRGCLRLTEGLLIVWTFYVPHADEIILTVVWNSVTNSHLTCFK